MIEPIMKSTLIFTLMLYLAPPVAACAQKLRNEPIIDKLIFNDNGSRGRDWLHLAGETESEQNAYLITGHTTTCFPNSYLERNDNTIFEYTADNYESIQERCIFYTKSYQENSLCRCHIGPDFKALCVVQEI